MAKEVLTHSDRYVRKTNRIILIVGIITLLVFLFGLMLLTTDVPEEEQHYEVEDTIDAETDLGMGNNTSNNEAEIEFDDAEEMERPITLTPNPINMAREQSVLFPSIWKMLLLRVLNLRIIVTTKSCAEKLPAQ